MRKLQIAIWAAALVATGSLQAQQRGTLAFGGAVLNQDGVLAGEMAQMSQPQALGTARSMALGGAFTSLGADLASMSINPAGLGMYRRNEIALTPMMTFQSSETPGTMSYAKNGKNRFSMANFGAALNAYEGTGARAHPASRGASRLNRIGGFQTAATPTRPIRALCRRFGYGAEIAGHLRAVSFGQARHPFPQRQRRIGPIMSIPITGGSAGLQRFYESTDRHFYTDPETSDGGKAHLCSRTAIGSNASTPP